MRNIASVLCVGLLIGHASIASAARCPGAGRYGIYSTPAQPGAASSPSYYVVDRQVHGVTARDNSTTEMDSIAASHIAMTSLA
jgi:hypothetical protein